METEAQYMGEEMQKDQKDIDRRIKYGKKIKNENNTKRQKKKKNKSM